MKKVFKTLKIILISGILLAIVLSVTAKLSENKITDIAVRKLSASITAPMEINKVSFTLIRRFPYATFEFNNMWLGSYFSDSTSLKIDTIAKIKNLYFSVKTLPLLKKEFEIAKIEIDGADGKYIIDKTGKSNFDFLMDTTQNTNKKDSSVSSVNIILSNLILKDINCQYVDSTLSAQAHMFIQNIKIKGNLRNNELNSTAKGSLKLSRLNSEKMNLHIKEDINLDFDLGFFKDSVSVEEFKLASELANIQINGHALLKDNIATNVEITCTDLDINKAQVYLPDSLFIKTGIRNIKGIVDLSASINGLVSKTDKPKVDMNISLKEGEIITTEYPEIKNLTFKGMLTNGFLQNNTTTSASFEGFHFETNKSKFDFNFSIQNIDHPKYLVESDLELDVSELERFIPDTVLQSLNGKLRASVHTKGQLPDSINGDFIDYLLETSRIKLESNNLFIAVDTVNYYDSLAFIFAYQPNHLQLDSFSVKAPAQNIALLNSSFDALFEGKLSQKDSIKLNLQKFDIRTNKSFINGSANIANLLQPKYNLNTSLQLNLDEFEHFAPDTLIESLSGNILAQISSTGNLNLDSLSEQIQEIIFNHSSFDFNFSNVSAKLKDTLIHVNGLTGQLSMNPDTVLINNLLGSYSNVDFEIIETRIANLYETLILKLPERLYVESDIQLSDVDYSMLGVFLYTDSTTQKEQNNAINAEQSNTEIKNTSLDFLIKGRFTVNSFTYNKAVINNISGLFNLMDSTYTVDQLTFNAFDGKMNTSAKFIKEKNGESKIYAKNLIEKVDIKKLLQDFDNFDQTTLKDENISGLFSADLNSLIVLNGNSIKKEDIRAKGDIKLENGGVYNFEPAMQQKMLSEINDMDNIKIHTLESYVFVFKSAISVPKTHIVTTAADVTAFGMKGFGEDYEYHVSAKLSELLLGKSEKKKEAQSKIETSIQEDKRSVRHYCVSPDKSVQGIESENSERRIVMQNRIKAQERLLDLRFDPHHISYETGVRYK